MNITRTIPSYCYVQYNDDPDIVAFFSAYNEEGQQRLDDTNAYQLPVFLEQSGSLLDWAATSIYGVVRPNLTSGGPRQVGPLNSFELNTEPLNAFAIVNSSRAFLADDDTYKRIIQWNTYKGDGFQFTMRWLKRRIQRFISGTLFPDQTYQVSVRFTGPNAVLISIATSLQRLVGGAFYNEQNFDALIPLSGIETVPLVPPTSTAFAAAFQAAVVSGALLLPFQYTFTVEIS
jgi:hypothetical protein